MSAFLKNLPLNGLGDKSLSTWDGKAILQVQNLVKYTVYNSCICSPHSLIPPPPPPPVTHGEGGGGAEHGEGGGGAEPVRRSEGPWFIRGAENTNMTDCILSL